VVKNHIADYCYFTIAGLRARLPGAFTKVTGDTCRKILEKVAQQEDCYWREDEKLGDVYAAGAEEEHVAEIGSPNEATHPYLGEEGYRYADRTVVSRYPERAIVGKGQPREGFTMRRPGTLGQPGWNTPSQDPLSPPARSPEAAARRPVDAAGAAAPCGRPVDGLSARPPALRLEDRSAVSHSQQALRARRMMNLDFSVLTHEDIH